MTKKQSRKKTVKASQGSSEQPIDFEQSLNQLDQLVKKLEDQNLPLEQALQTFEQGVALTRQCQQALAHAEQKIKILTQQQGSYQLQDFEQDKPQQTQAENTPDTDDRPNDMDDDNLLH